MIAVTTGPRFINLGGAFSFADAPYIFWLCPFFTLFEAAEEPKSYAFTDQIKCFLQKKATVFVAQGFVAAGCGGRSKIIVSG